MDSSFSLLWVCAGAIGLFTLLGGLLFMFHKKLRPNPQTKIIASSSWLPSFPQSSSLRSPLISLPSSSFRNWKHNVFLNFDLGDGRKASIFLEEARSRGIVGIERSKSIHFAAIDAIRGSRIAIVMLSRIYACSSSCLDELAEIIKCREEFGQLVAPIFCDLDPSDVKNQTGDFGKFFSIACKGKTKEDIGRWRHALDKVAEISGYHISNRDDEAAMSKRIAIDISNILNISTPSSDFQGLVGMDAHTEKMGPMLRTSVDGHSLCSEDKNQEDLVNYCSPSTPTAHTTLYKSERALEQTSTELLHAVYILCVDTLQYSFPSHLSMEFRRKGIYAPVNYNGTQDMIEGVSAFLVVFSKNYLSSTSCLDNLVRVLQCRKSGQVVIPVFYGISPSDVKLLECKSADQLSEWSSAVQEVRKLPGYLYSREECNESELVEKIVNNVYEKLFPVEQIGINSRLLEIEQLLCKQPCGIRRLGIWGMPGIGKTTLAKAVFDLMSGGYEACCFINHFDKAFHEKGRHRLLKEHFRDVLKKLPRECSSITRPSLTGNNLSKKRTLVVLDDVHNPLVADSFLEGFHWFGPGSLIIITSRDKQVFRLCQITHVYEVRSLDENEALRLFSQCVDVKGKKVRNLLNLSKEMTDYANGNPLALSYYGRELKGKKLSEMETKFLKFKLCIPHQIHNLFKSSYDTLNDIEKNIFLDIACFFNGEKVEYVMQLLEGCGFFPHIGIDVLVEKCLVTMSENRVKMHRIIQDFGREIIIRETVQIERCSRLWEPRTIRFLLEDDKLGENEEATSSWAMDTEDIEVIFLDASSLLFDVKPTAFEDMLNLRFLNIYYSGYDSSHGLGLPKGLESLPYELRLLHWEKYPLQSLPRDFDPCYLVELNMPNSQLQTLWRGTKNLDMLKVVRLCHSQQLTGIDDICKAKKLEIIDLQGCTKLQSFPTTGHLQHLRVVNLSGCREIKSLPEVSPNIKELKLKGTDIRELPVSIGNATNLEILDFSNGSNLVELPSSIGNVANPNKLCLTGCSSHGKLPSSIGNSINLKELYLSGCSCLVELPASIGNAINLEVLDLCKFTSLVELPTWFGNLINLKKLYLNGCSSLVELSLSFDRAISLKELYLRRCLNLVELPGSIGNVGSLKILDLSYCSSLVELPSSIECLFNLEELYLTGCSCLIKLPARIGNAFNLEILDLSNCSSLVELPFSLGNAHKLQKLNLEYCSRLVKLPSSFGNDIYHLKKIYLTGCSSLMDLPSSIKNSTRLISLDLYEDNNLPVLTFGTNSGSKYIEVRRAKRGNFFVLKGEQNDEHSVSLNLRMVDGNGCVRDTYFLFYQNDTASKVSRKMVKQLELTNQEVTFIAELIDILFVNIIPNWKTDVAVDHLNQNEAKTQIQEGTDFHDTCELVSQPWTSDFPWSDTDEEDKQCVDDIKMEDVSSDQEAEEATEAVSLEEEERLRQELEDIEAKYQEEMQEIARKIEAIMERKKKLSHMKKRTK